MTVTLPTDLEEFVASGVAKGRFKSADDAVQRAVQLLRDDDEERRVKYEQLKSDIAIGIAEEERGELVAFDPEKLIEEMGPIIERRREFQCSK
jgi:antitoxin ParD1/3/4